jgi:tetratricopeptide (TPR) repeat protein
MAPINPILIAVLCIIILVATSFRGRRYQKLMLRLENYYEQGKYHEAIAVCNSILKWSPFAPHVLYLRGNMLSEVGKYAEAVANYDRALKYSKYLGELNPYQAWRLRGFALFNLNLYAEALHSFEKALKHNPESWHSLTMCGCSLTKLQRYEESLAILDQVLVLNPENAPAFYERACCYALQGNTAKAIDNLERSIFFGKEAFRDHAKTDQDLDSIRFDDRFKELILSAEKTTEVVAGYR